MAVSVKYLRSRSAVPTSASGAKKARLCENGRRGKRAEEEGGGEKQTGAAGDGYIC